MAKYDAKNYAIQTGIGLQDVDRLENSSFFVSESERYIRGEISLDELDQVVHSYYESKPDEKDRAEEADKIAIRIAQTLGEEAFTFSVGQLRTSHRSMFHGLLPRAGECRA